jgi:integrase
MFQYNITYRKKDNGWQYTIEVGRDLNGKRKQKSKGGFKTKRECQEAMIAAETLIDKGEYFIAENITFKDYLSKWLSDYAKIATAPRTYYRYEEIINKYINPKLGTIELNKLKPLHIQGFYNYCINDLNLSTTTVRQFHAIIHKALNKAVEWQMVNNNCSNAVDKPKKAKVDFTVLGDIETNMLLKRLEHMTLYIPVLIAVTTGMRRGEICGLKWENIDLDNGIIYVKEQLQKIENKLELVKVKTDGSKRKIIMLDYTIPILKEHKKKYLTLKLRLGEAFKDEGFVVFQADGSPYEPEYITKNYGRVLGRISKELAIPKIRFHDLRHTHATLMLKAGVHPKVVAERLGHSSITMTLNTYSHVLPDMQQEAAEKLNALLIK